MSYSKINVVFNSEGNTPDFCGTNYITVSFTEPSVETKPSNFKAPWFYWDNDTASAVETLMEDSMD